MKDLPEKLEPGGAIEEKITSKLINAMLAAIRRCQPPEQVKGGRIGSSPAGWTLAIDPGNNSSTSFPLKPVQTAPTKIRIKYGTVHGIVPKIGTDAITAEIADEANPEITVTFSGKLYVKVDLAADTYEAENPTIAFAAEVPADVDRESAHQELAAVTYASGAITAIVPVHQGSLDVASCAGVTNYWDLG